MDERAFAATQVFGHNTEVSYRGTVYHVQTENVSDSAEPSITTLVYHQGSLVTKVSSSYADIAGGAEVLASLKERVRRQHLSVLSRIKRGELRRDGG